MLPLFCVQHDIDYSQKGLAPYRRAMKSRSRRRNSSYLISKHECPFLLSIGGSIACGLNLDDVRFLSIKHIFLSGSHLSSISYVSLVLDLYCTPIMLQSTYFSPSEASSLPGHVVSWTIPDLLDSVRSGALVTQILANES